MRPLLGRARIGQLPPEWYQRAKDAVARYDALVEQASLVADEGARGDLLLWLGRTDVLSDPAERYDHVVTDLKRAEVQTPPDYTVFTEQLVKDRIEQLEAINLEFGAKVQNAVEAYGSLAASAGAPSQPGRKIAASVLTGSVALFGLVVLPLVLD